MLGGYTLAVLAPTGKTTIVRTSRAGGPLRLIWGGLVFAVSLLAVFQAPTFLLWQLAVVVTEWGHLLALAALAALWPGWRHSRAGVAGGVLGLGAAILALSPLARAIGPASELPARLDAAFGPAAAPLGLAAPLAAVPLLTGIPMTQVEPRRLVYAAPAGRELTLDFYPARADSPAPVVVVIHGGSWQSGDSTQLAPLNSYLVGRGYAVAALNYRLAPEWPFPAARDDVRAAVAFLKAGAAELGIDPGRIALLGRSAGGQLALLAAYATADPAIRGVIAFYAPTDMIYGYENPSNPLVIDSRGVLEAYLGGTPGTARAAYEAASPMRFVGPATPPTLLIHGARDELVRLRQSERLAEALAAAGHPHLLVTLPWATHGADFNLSGPAGQISTYAVEQFLNTVMAP